MNQQKAASSSRTDFASGPEAIIRPDPEVAAQAKRHRFTADYKQRILAQADQAKGSGVVGALLRREGLYSSLLTAWRREVESRTRLYRTRFSGHNLVHAAIAFAWRYSCRA